VPSFALVREAAQSLEGETLRIEWRGTDDAQERALVEGDAARLRAVVTSLIAALAREVIDGRGLVIDRRIGAFEGRGMALVVVADHARARELAEVDVTALGPFDEMRGGSGLALPIARRVIEAHGGRIWSPRAESRQPAIAVGLPLK
jgi:signal transduction histidine kinase